MDSKFMNIQDLSDNYMWLELDDTKAQQIKGGHNHKHDPLPEDPDIPGYVPPEHGYKLVWGKCDAHEIIGPDGKCVSWLDLN